MPLTAPPTIPLITDPSTFSARAQDWVVWQSDELYPALVDASLTLGLSLSSVSTTSNTVGTGSKSFTVETGKGFAAGQSLVIADSITPTNRMFGVVDTYNSVTGALVFISQAFEGSGTLIDWTISPTLNAVLTLAQIPDALITGAKLSAGAPNWDANGVFVGGTAALDLSPSGTGQYPKLGVYFTTEIVGLAASKYSNDSAGSQILMTKSRGAAVGAETIVQNNDVVGRLIFRAADGTNYVNAGYIECAIDGTPNTNDMPARLSFFTSNDGTATSTEKFRIANDGSFSSVIPAGSTLYPEFKCRAWVNFFGTGTPSARAVGNVSSITDNGVGDYTINFTTALPDVNYSVVGNSGAAASFSAVSIAVNAAGARVAPTVSAIRIACTNFSVARDPDDVNLAVFR